MQIKKIILSRTDNIGDVILTLPMAGFLKKHFPNVKIAFLGKKYTHDIIRMYAFVDEFYDWDEIKKSPNPVACFKNINADSIVHVFPNKDIALFAKKAGIKLRVGTNRRWFHWLTCNRLINLSRRHSHLHESQLNLKLLEFLKLNVNIPLNEVTDFFQFLPFDHKKEFILSLVDKNKFNLILHPKSKGSAKEWTPEHFVRLINSLPKEKFRIFISGITEEEEFIKKHILTQCPHAVNVVGKFSLFDFISFIDECDGFISASTGPLHIASALNKNAIGIYPPVQSMSPSRWGPIGKKTTCIIGHSDHLNCKKSCSTPIICNCINNDFIFTQVQKTILSWNKS